MTQAETVKFKFEQYQRNPNRFENDLVARLPGLLITQFSMPQVALPGLGDDTVVLRFDFTDEWYSVQVFLDSEGKSTGHYRVTIQTPLRKEGDVWAGNDLLLGLEIAPEFHYTVMGEEQFISAVEDGWMKVYTAAKAREALRSLCAMVDAGSLPQEVMDAVHE